MLIEQSRRSPLGLFCRSMTIGLTKLSFEDTTRLSKQVAEWISSSKTKLVPVERLNREYSCFACITYVQKVGQP